MAVKIEMRGPVVTMQTLKTSRVEVFLRGPAEVPVPALAAAVVEHLPGGALSGVDVDVPGEDDGADGSEVRIAWTVPISDGAEEATAKVRRVRALAEHLEQRVVPSALAAFEVHHAAITGRRPD